MFYVIMADGKGKRWDNYHEIPKHLITYQGETLLARTVRLIRERDPEAEVVITSHDPRYEIDGATRYEPKHNVLEIDRFTKELIRDDMCFLYGDTFYTEEAMQTIVSRPAEPLVFFGNSRSIIAIKIRDGKLFGDLVAKVRKMYKAGEIAACKGWQVYRLYAGLDLNERAVGKDFVQVEDATKDFNSAADLDEEGKFQAGNSSPALDICFTGDLSFTGYYRGWDGGKILSDAVQSFIAESDASVINLESPVTESADAQKEILVHRSPASLLRFVDSVFPDPVISLANNHIMDYGSRGLTDTIQAIRKKGFPFIGAGKDIDEAVRPVVITADGISVGLLAVQYKEDMIAGKHSSGPAQDNHSKYIRAAIRELKKETDYVALVYHGGDEFLRMPLPYMRRRFRRFVSWGADVVVGHHPHVVEGYETYKGKQIFYSLGNFLFDTDYQRQQQGTDRGVLLRLTFQQDGISFTPLALQLDRTSGMLNEGEMDPFFVDLAAVDYASCWRAEAKRKAKVLRTINAYKKTAREALPREDSVPKTAEGGIPENRKQPLGYQVRNLKRKAEKKICIKRGQA